MLDKIKFGTTLEDKIQRARPDLIFIPRGGKPMYIECKSTNYDKNNTSHSLQVSAIQFAIQFKYYDNDIPLRYFIYSKTNREWHMFWLAEGYIHIDHVKHVDGNETELLYQCLPVLKTKPFFPCSPGASDASRQDMLGFNKNLYTRGLFVEKILQP